MVSRTHQSVLVGVLVMYGTTACFAGWLGWRYFIHPIQFQISTLVNPAIKMTRPYQSTDKMIWQQVSHQHEAMIRQQLIDMPHRFVQLRKLSLHIAKDHKAWRSLVVKVGLIGSFAGLMHWLSLWVNQHRVFKLDAMTLSRTSTRQLEMSLEATYPITNRGAE